MGGDERSATRRGAWTGGTSAVRCWLRLGCAVLVLIAGDVDRVAGGAEPALAQWLAELPRGDRIRFFDGNPDARKLRLGSNGTETRRHETRNAVPAGKQPLTLTTSIGAGDSLEVAMAVACPPPASDCVGELELRITAEVEGEATRSLVRERVAAGSGWQHRRLEIGELAGKRVRFTFASAPSESPARPRGAFPVAFWGEPLLRRAHRDGRFNLILVSIDTLRADRLGSYGYERKTSPALDALARQGVRFEQAISQSPWTTPSHISMMTSLHPSSHRVNESWRPPPERGEAPGGYRRLSNEVVTLAEILQQGGYATVAMTGGATVSGEIGFDKGFDRYGESNLASREQWDVVRGTLRDLQATPFFLFLHTFDVHAPYLHPRYVKPLLDDAQFEELERQAERPPEMGRADFKKKYQRHLRDSGLMRREITSALYDGGIRYVDDFLIGPLVAELRAMGLYDRTLILVTSDHGEEFGEHDPTRFYDAHCTNLYDPLVRVPLIIRMPGRFDSGVVVEEQVRSIDIPPTVLDLLSFDVPDEMEGRSMTPLMEGRGGGHPTWAISEATCVGPEWKSLRSLESKYLVSHHSAGAWWEVDLGEKVDIEEIRIWNRTDCCQGQLSRYWVLVSDSAAPSVGATANFARFEAHPAGRPTIVKVGASGRHVRIQASGDSVVEIAEIEVMRGSGDELTNAALGKSATQSGTAFGGSASRAVDGNTSGDFRDGSVSHTEWRAPETERTGIHGVREIELLFDLAADPGEQHSLHEQERETAERLRLMLRERIEALASKSREEPERIEVDDETLERLRALGYIE